QSRTLCIVHSVPQSFTTRRSSDLVFSRNFGKEAALFAGLEHAEGDLMIPMDVDLQDPFELIFEMITAYEKGADIVLARRANRGRSEEHTSELQSRENLVCSLLLVK